MNLSNQSRKQTLLYRSINAYWLATASFIYNHESTIVAIGYGSMIIWTLVLLANGFKYLSLKELPQYFRYGFPFLMLPLLLAGIVPANAREIASFVMLSVSVAIVMYSLFERQR